MRSLVLLTLALGLGCGGRTTEDPSSTDAAPTDSAPADVAPADSSATCFTTTIPSVPYKVCTNDSDCMVASHQLDCCGNSVLVGVAKSQSSAFGTCETAWDKTFPGCGCPAMAPTAEDGKTVPFGETPTVHCVDRTSTSGICKTFAP